eukprot:8460573-Pyramimonas_sp.AAC.1
MESGRRRGFGTRRCFACDQQTSPGIRRATAATSGMPDTRANVHTNACHTASADPPAPACASN